MAVEARHINLLQSQFLPNRDMINPIEGNNTNLYNNTTMMETGSQVPFSVIDNTMDNLLPLYYNNSSHAMPLPLLMPPLKTAAVKSDNSGVTYDISTSRKRSRDQSIINPFVNAAYNNISCNSQAQQTHATNSLSFLGEDLSSFVQSQELEIEQLISRHMEKLRHEVEKRKTQEKKTIEAVQVGIMKRLKAKDIEIQEIGKLNWALEERVKTLCMENQIWRDMAQSNEATANALRTNLEQVLAQIKNDAAELDDAQSCCGSSGDEERTWAANYDHGLKDKRRLCKNCFKDESCVLLLPCRHLCLCTNCGSSLDVCPVCKSINNASVHVNMS